MNHKYLYCSDNLKTNKKNKQGKKHFISLLTSNNQDIKHNGSLRKLITEENNLNKKQSIGESYHIQTFDEMFND